MIESFTVLSGASLDLSSLYQAVTPVMNGKDFGVKLRPNDGVVDITTSDWSGIDVADVQAAIDDVPTVDKALRLKDEKVLSGDCKFQSLVHWIAAAHDKTVDEVNAELLVILEDL